MGSLRMSDITAVTDLKGGHAPAQKVGGMRVVTKPRMSESDKPVEKTKSEEGEEDQPEEVEKEDKKRVVISGATTGEEEAFPKEAVKAFHEKPQPTLEKGAIYKPKIIQQPRK